MKSKTTVSTINEEEPYFCERKHSNLDYIHTAAFPARGKLWETFSFPPGLSCYGAAEVTLDYYVLGENTWVG